MYQDVHYQRVSELYSSPLREIKESDWWLLAKHALQHKRRVFSHDGITWGIHWVVALRLASVVGRVIPHAFGYDFTTVVKVEGMWHDGRAGVCYSIHQSGKVFRPVLFAF